MPRKCSGPSDPRNHRASHNGLTVDLDDKLAALGQRVHAQQADAHAAALEHFPSLALLQASFGAALLAVRWGQREWRAAPAELGWTSVKLSEMGPVQMTSRERIGKKRR